MGINVQEFIEEHGSEEAVLFAFEVLRRDRYVVVAWGAEDVYSMLGERFPMIDEVQRPVVVDRVLDSKRFQDMSNIDDGQYELLEQIISEVIGE